jgi:hypothetical protein
MKWHFTPYPADLVETEVTQRDQFNNDEVDLAETIVREAVQNSLDAASDDAGTVTVSFRTVRPSDGLDPGFCQSLLKDQRMHAEVAGLDLGAVDPDKPTALVIEDFGTCGLTGSINSKDDDNFSDFWRRHGKSHKSGKSRGRWGLGKLVYSCTSQVGVFFGLTRRAGDPADHLLGQTVLNVRKLNGATYPPHAYFCDLEHEDDPQRRMPVPIKDKEFVLRFREQFAIRRTDQPGLSVVIPFPDPGFSKDRMIGVAVHNYFYPLITGKLKLEFDDVLVDSSNVRALAHQHAAGHFGQIDLLFDFIEEASSAMPDTILRMKESWADDSMLGEDDFEADTLEKVRGRFAASELVALRLPVTIVRKNGEKRKSSFSIFLKRPEQLDKGLDLYVRGGLTLPAESKFRERRALGVLVAEEEAICAFLGDAENAAHTLWTTNTEKLRKNYRTTQSLVTMIKKALVQLYDLLAEVSEEADEDALSRFFWFEEPESSQKDRQRKKRSSPAPPPEIKPRGRPFSVEEYAGGFRIKNSGTADSSALPFVLRVKAAYEVSRGDAFSKWSKHDFEMKRDIRVEVDYGATVTGAAGQELVVVVKELPFSVRATEFDPNRDLKVRVVTEST